MSSFVKPSSSYVVPANLATEFTPSEINQFKSEFQVFDLNGDGEVDADELTVIMEKLGEKVTKLKLEEMIAEVDEDKNGTVSFGEFVQMMQTVKKSGVSRILCASVDISKHALLGIFIFFLFLSSPFHIFIENESYTLKQQNRMTPNFLLIR